MSLLPDARLLAGPTSAEPPCGPDLDLLGDVEFHSFMATMEGHLPAHAGRSYFDFDPKSIAFDVVMAEGQKLLARSRDVRLFVMLAKLGILGGGIVPFAAWVEALSQHLSDLWDSINPKGEGSDFSLRLAPITTLDDYPPVIMPFQHATLLESRRDGRISLRSQLIALGEVSRRETDPKLEASAIERAINDADLDVLKTTDAALRKLQAALASIAKVTEERAGPLQKVSLTVLPGMVARAIALLDPSIARRDPARLAASAAAPEAGSAAAAAAPAPTSKLASLEEADGALGSALAYFETREPSSPLVLLVGQARKLLGKNLFEVMQSLLPPLAAGAKIKIVDQMLTVPVSSLGESSRKFTATSTPQPARSRSEAIAKLSDVIAFFRANEPSSPIPSILDRAVGLNGQDFRSVLREVLPEDPPPAKSR